LNVTQAIDSKSGLITGELSGLSPCGIGIARSAERIHSSLGFPTIAIIRIESAIRIGSGPDELECTNGVGLSYLIEFTQDWDDIRG